MEYSIKAHPTTYGGVLFRSRLEARWACFFDLVRWKWQYEPLDLYGWTPDFRVEIPCQRNACHLLTHVLLVEVKPYFHVEDFCKHPCMKYPYGGFEERIPADASAAFGVNPRVTQWEMSCGDGGGIETVDGNLCVDVDELWKEAGNITQWHPNVGKQHKPFSIEKHMEHKFKESHEPSRLQPHSEISGLKISAKRAGLLDEYEALKERISNKTNETDELDSLVALIDFARKVHSVNNG